MHTLSCCIILHYFIIFTLKVQPFKCAFRVTSNNVRPKHANLIFIPCRTITSLCFRRFMICAGETFRSTFFEQSLKIVQQKAQSSYHMACHCKLGTSFMTNIQLVKSVRLAHPMFKIKCMWGNFIFSAEDERIFNRDCYSIQCCLLTIQTGKIKTTDKSPILMKENFICDL